MKKYFAALLIVAISSPLNAQIQQGSTKEVGATVTSSGKPRWEDFRGHQDLPDQAACDRFLAKASNATCSVKP